MTGIDTIRQFADDFTEEHTRSSFAKIEPPTAATKKISDTSATNTSKKGIKNDSIKIPIGKP